MANALKYLNKERSAGSPFIRKNFQCTLSGNYLTSGALANIGIAGEILSFNTASYPPGAHRVRIPNVLNGSTSPLVPNTNFRPSPLALPCGYVGQIEQNAVAPTANNYILRIFTPAGTELGSGAYPAGLLQPFVIGVLVPSKYD